MNIKTLYTIAAIGLLISVTACEDDFLDRYPEDAMSDATFFTKASDFRTYVNGLYGTILRNTPNVPILENGTDNLFAEKPAGSEMQHAQSGIANQTNAVWNGNYTNIRKVNYLLDNKGKITEREIEVNQYIGEAFYMRACYYISLLETFGGVPYIDKVLETDSPELFKERESRTFIALEIMKDLDSAAANMGWKGEGFALAPRLNKESALLMKTRVGLFEGSWEYYHGRKNTPFKADGKDGLNFLNLAVTAGDALIAKQGTNIYKGRAGFEYYDLFNRQDYSDVAGAFLYKHFDAALSVSEDHQTSLLSWTCGLTNDAVKNYLMSDGKPEGVSDVTYDYKYQGSVIAARDPRLNQTIYSPARGPFANMITWQGGASESASYSPYMDLNNTFGGQGGYMIIKGMLNHYVDRWSDNQDNLILRYGEALLNYAEAKAILGTITQSDIDKTVNVLRDRVGMAHLSMSEANSWLVTYEVSKGFDPTASNILNEIRRERRAELLLEDFRKMDLKRWAIYEDVINGYKPVGAYYQELADWWNNRDLVLAAGYSPSQLNSLKLTIGQNINVTGEYVNHFWKEADFTAAGRGYYISPLRDYLSAIPKVEIDFYKSKAGVVLLQNPGWI